MIMKVIMMMMNKYMITYTCTYTLHHIDEHKCDLSRPSWMCVDTQVPMPPPPPPQKWIHPLGGSSQWKFHVLSTEISSILRNCRILRIFKAYNEYQWIKIIKVPKVPGLKYLEQRAAAWIWNHLAMSVVSNLCFPWAKIGWCSAQQT